MGDIFSTRMNDYDDNSLYHRPRGKVFRTIVLVRLCRNIAGAASSVRCHQSIQLAGLLHTTRNKLCLEIKNTREVHTIIYILFQENSPYIKTALLDHPCQHESSELTEEFHKCQTGCQARVVPG